MARLTKIYTRTGDQGTTRLGDGTPLDKHHLRIQCIGEIDELNALIGLIIAHDTPKKITQQLTHIQHQLFEAGGELCMPGYTRLTPENTHWLEQQIDHMNTTLAPLQEFILPGGSLPAAHTHHARTVCRRAERALTQLTQTDPLSPHLLTYINRLSDYLFVATRHINQQLNQPDILWDKKNG